MGQCSLTPAVKFWDEVFVGYDHRQIIDEVIPATLGLSIRPKVTEDDFGFVTERNKFLGRMTALRYARQNHLLKDEEMEYDTLLSEHLISYVKRKDRKVKVYSIDRITANWMDKGFEKVGSKKKRQLQWLSARFGELNAEHFDGKLKEPPFNVTAFKMRKGQSSFRWGHWSYRHRVMKINGDMFKYLDKEFVNTTLLHEMCHQAVSDIDGIRFRISKAHDERWKKWMKKVGLPPKSTFPSEIHWERG